VGSTLPGPLAEAPLSIVPLITSLAVALGGLLVGWLAYRNVKSVRQDALQVPVLVRKWYVDEIYSALFIKPVTWLAETFVSQWLDKGLIDGTLDLFGKAAAGIGSNLRNAFDKPVINAFFGDGTASLVQGTGRHLRPIQTGRIQQYMLISLLVLLILAGLVYFISARN
jgi:NADH-quinone oxidoreductase subunit L